MAMTAGWAGVDAGDESTARLYDASDLAWIRGLLDLVEATIGESWRVLTSRLESAALAASIADRWAMLATLQRWLGNDLVLHGCEIERKVVLLAGRPPEAELAAFANLARLQRWLRRARSVELRVWGEATRLGRVIAGLGLIVDARREGDATVFAIVGPLDLPHAVVRYGRVIGELAACLTAHARFALDIVDGLGDREPVRRRVEAPALLPPACLLPRGDVAAALARELGELGLAVDREPSPIEVDGHVLFPQLAFVERGVAWCVELVEYSTPDSLARKLARYRAAQRPVVLCVEQRLAAGSDLALGVCGFVRQVDARDVLAIVRG